MIYPSTPLQPVQSSHFTTCRSRRAVVSASPSDIRLSNDTTSSLACSVTDVEAFLRTHGERVFAMRHSGLAAQSVVIFETTTRARLQTLDRPCPSKTNSLLSVLKERYRHSGPIDKAKLGNIDVTPLGR